MVAQNEEISLWLISKSGRIVKDRKGQKRKVEERRHHFFFFLSSRQQENVK